MKKMWLCCLFLLGCYSSQDNNLVAQPKKIARLSPIVCPNRTEVDLSLGVTKDGVGSMSTEDQWMWVPNESDRDTLQTAIEKHKLVKVYYRVARLAVCVNQFEATKIEIME